MGKTTKNCNFTVCLTEQDRHYLDFIAEAHGVSGGPFLAGLLRREIVKEIASIAQTVITRSCAVKYGVPEKIADMLNEPKDLESIMEAGKYQQFFDECRHGTMGEIKAIMAKLDCKKAEEVNNAGN